MPLSLFIEKRKLRLAKRIAENAEGFDLSSVIAPHAFAAKIETAPFPHVVIEDFFTPRAYKAIEREFLAALALGFSTSSDDANRFHSFDIEYDGYIYIPSHYRFKHSPLSVFYSLSWNAFFSDLFKRDTSFATSMAFHHHPPGDSTGFVHHDFSNKYFSERARLPTLVIPYSEKETEGELPPSVFIEKRVIALLLYLANPPWYEGDGGETALYAADKETIVRKVPPVNNRLLAFSLSERSFHAFQENKLPRNCIVQWFHLSERLL